MKKIILWIMIFVFNDTQLIYGMILKSRVSRFPAASKTVSVVGKTLPSSPQPIQSISPDVSSAQSKLAYLKQKDVLNNFNQKDLSSMPSKGSWSALFATLGLGWLWHNTEDEDEKKLDKEIDEKHMSLDQFVKKFAPPQEIQETIEAHKDGIATFGGKPYLIEGTQPPIYHKKNDIYRIIDAELLREVIKENNLNIEIPKKYVYPNPNNGEYQVFAEGMAGKSLENEQLILKDVQSLVVLAAESSFSDVSPYNIFRDMQNNKLIIVDTERSSFSSIDRGYYEPKIRCVRQIIDKLNNHFKLHKDAQIWAANYLKKLEDSEAGQEKVDLYGSHYNTLHISVENVRKLEQEIYQQNQKQKTFTAKILWSIKRAMRS